MNSNWISRVRRSLGLLLLALAVVGCAPTKTRLDPASIQSASAPVSREKTIALLGGTGMTGGYLLREALARGYRIRLLSRASDRFTYLSDRVEVVVGDALDPSTIATLLEGSDAVISAIGPGANGPENLNSRTTSNVIAAMSNTATRPYLVVSGAAVKLSVDERNFSGKVMRRLALWRYPTLAADRQREYELLAESPIPWTLLRCPLIESAMGENVADMSLSTPPGWRVQAGALARFALDEIEDGQFRRRAPFLASD